MHAHLLLLTCLKPCAPHWAGLDWAHAWAQAQRLAMREVRALRECGQHPHVVSLLDAFRTRSGQVYLVMVRALQFIQDCVG